MALTNIPVFSDVIDQTFFVDRLGGPSHPLSLLDRFPDELYTKTLDSHLVRFLYAMLGPAGIGWLQKNLLDARLAIDAAGIDLFDLESFYGDPFSFGRILDEQYDPTIGDPNLSLQERQEWDTINAQDARYRSRAMDYFNGARAGNSPLGLQLVARSGLGHDVEIVENYKYLYSLHTAEPYTTPFYGSSDKCEEFVVLPRRETSRSAVQTIVVLNNPTSGTFTLTFNGQTTSQLLYNATALDMQAALRALSTIGGNVDVIGGPSTTGLNTTFQPYVVTFTGALSNRPVALLTAQNYLNGNPAPEITVDMTTGGIESVDEPVLIPDADKHHLMVGLDYIRPVNTIFSTYHGTGLRRRQPWIAALASSEYTEVIRYVTGNPAVPWPAIGDGIHWIQAGQEIAAPRIFGDLQHHYVGFHNVQAMTAYTDLALNDPNYLADMSVLANYNSEHLGPFSNLQVAAVPVLGAIDDSDDHLTASRALADYAEPLTVTSQISDPALASTPVTIQTQTTTGTPVSLINGIYPDDYATLPGVPQVVYRSDDFWGSLERSGGDEYLEIDLGTRQFVNYISFEITKKPLLIEIAYDSLNDRAPRRQWLQVVPVGGLDYPSSITYTPEEAAAWFSAEFHFEDGKGNIPLTRFIRIKFQRVTTGISPFLYDSTNRIQYPWSVEVRNLRIGRNVSN